MKLSKRLFSNEMQFVLLFITLLVIALSPTFVSAAEIEEGRPGVCKKTLRGTIEAGDAKKLRAIEDELFKGLYGDVDFGVVRICLDSGGGSFLGGLELARFFKERKVGTAVADGEACLSACAIAFMFGSEHVISSDGVINRRLHKNGKLGFHRPSIQIPQAKNFDSKQLEKAFNVAMKTNQALLALAGQSRPLTTGRPFMDGDLIEQMLKHEGENFYFIDTVNKAGRWDIDVFGFTPPVLGERTLYYACQNMTQWQSGFMRHQLPFEKAGSDAVRFSRENAHSDFKDETLYKATFVAMDDFQCSAGSRKWVKGTFRDVICGYDLSNGGRVGPDRCEDEKSFWLWPDIPDVARLPADTLLSSIPD